MLNPRWLASHNHFFYWRLRFPDVFRLTAGEDSPDTPETGWMGGFDLVPGSPPWDTLSPDTKKFISTYDPPGTNRGARGPGPNHGATDPLVANRWDAYQQELCAQVHFFKNSGHYRLSAPGNRGKGDFNINDANCMAILKALFEDCRLDMPSSSLSDLRIEAAP